MLAPVYRRWRWKTQKRNVRDVIAASMKSTSSDLIEQPDVTQMILQMKPDWEIGTLHLKADDLIGA